MAYSTNNNAGGHVKSTKPTNPKVPEEVYEQGNAVYYYSLDTKSKGNSYANITMDGDYNTAYYTKGAIDNYGTIDLRSKYDLDNQNNDRLGFGNVGVFSSNTNVASTNYGTITTGMSDTINMRYSAAAKTAGQTNGQGGTDDLYGGTESSIEEGTAGNPKTTGVGTTITAPDIVPITKVSVDGIDTPVFNVESDAANPGDLAKNITVSSSIQTGGTRIIDLYTHDEWGNPA